MFNLTTLVRGSSAAAVAMMIGLSTPVSAADNPQVAAEVIALARAQWASDTAGQSPAQQMVSLADDYTEFNSDYPTLLVGKEVALRMAAIPQYDKRVFSEMQNARVQVYGNTAILTYNFVGIRAGADGKTKPQNTKSTRVYVKQGANWMLVHANFAPLELPTP